MTEGPRSADGRPPDSHDAGRRAIVGTVEAMFARGLISGSGHANISHRIDTDAMFLTRGVVRGITTADMALTRFDGRVEEGELDPPSREIVQMHAVVYEHDPSVEMVVHSHSAYLGAFAVAGRPVPVCYEPLLRVAQTLPIPVVPWAPRGSTESVTGIRRALEDNPGTKAVLLANHGPLVFGASADDVVLRMVTLEEAAERELLARSLGGGAPLPVDAGRAVADRMRASGADHFIGI